MDSNTKVNLSGLKVVSFESRRAKEMAELIRRYGGEPISAPSMREVPLEENRAAFELVPQLESGKFDLLILMTGVGTRTLNQALLTQYSQDRILIALRRVKLIARGPKPIGALKELGLAPAFSVPEPNTWREVLATLEAVGGIHGKRIAVQEYGIPNRELVAELENRGAKVAAIPIYRWALPEDLAPLREAIRRILNCEADVALFTNGAQIDHLFRVANEDKTAEVLHSAMKKLAVGSIGPVCTEVLEKFGLEPDLEPSHPKMGSLIAEIAASARGILAQKNAK